MTFNQTPTPSLVSRLRIQKVLFLSRQSRSQSGSAQHAHRIATGILKEYSETRRLRWLTLIGRLKPGVTNGKRTPN